VLLAYIDKIMKPEALETYKHLLDWYMNGKLKDKPQIPPILRDV
jgi:hypothetical protein